MKRLIPFVAGFLLVGTAVEAQEGLTVTIANVKTPTPPNGRRTEKKRTSMKVPAKGSK